MTTTPTEPIAPEDRVLDWVPRPYDPRNEKFRVAVLGPRFGTGRVRNRTWRRQAWLDQGREGACTGFGLAHCLDSTPLHQVMTDAMGQQFYYEARRRDEWPGEEYEGSSVHGAMEAGVHFGYVREYWWARTMDEVDLGLSNFGPFEIGVDWWTGMFYPDANGVIAPTGKVEGGHALKLAGRKVTADGVLYRLDNSWGHGWGKDGSAYVTRDTLAKLMADGGEFALPRKRKTPVPQA